MQTRESSVKAGERRIGPRTKLVEIAYIGMGPENGGLVLDVSDGGLSFHSVAPVQPAEKINFLLSLRGHSRIEGAGEVVWTNEMGTVCGMKFTSLSVGALEYLNNWTNQSRTASPASTARPAAANRENTADLAPKADVAASTDLNRTTFSDAPVLAIAPADEESSSESIATSRWQTPLFFWTAFGILAAALPITAFLFGVRVGKSEYKSVARPALDHGSQASQSIISSPPTSTLPDADSTKASPENTPLLPTAEAPVPSREPVNASNAGGILGNTIQAAGKSGSHHSKQTSDDGKSDLAAALAQLNGDNGSRDTSSAVRLLRAAVAKGNAAAAVTLADLYVYGDGVEKNCEQGRFLLTTASKNGSVQAKMKLEELNADGCP